MIQFDQEIKKQDIQELSSADALTGFLARLGYNTNARISQSPANLDITAEGTTRPIRKIELLADQEGLLQVYLFELSSVTVTHTRALARTFRNKAGNFLLILTSDYEQIDFVLIERILPSTPKTASEMGTRQVGIRPRVLTVDRRNPTKVQRRVLRRFTYTEADPFALFDKLLSAYAISDWSEEHFNNRALFSDYYLKERLPEFEEWQEDSKPSYLALRDFFQGASKKYMNKEEGYLRSELFEPVFEIRLYLESG